MLRISGMTMFLGMVVLLLALVKLLSCLVKRALLRAPRVGSLSTHEVDR
jgi:hypothetical protein